MIVESYWPQKNKQKPKREVTPCISTSRAAGNYNCYSKLKQTCGLTGLKYAAEMTGISDYMCTSTFCVAHSRQSRVRLEFTLGCFTGQFTPRLLTLFFCLHFIMKWQQKVSLFFMQQRMAVETENQENGLVKKRLSIFSPFIQNNWSGNF